MKKCLLWRPLGRSATNKAPRVFDDVMKVVQLHILTDSKPALLSFDIKSPGSSHPETQFAQLSTAVASDSEYQLSWVHLPSPSGTVPSSWHRSNSWRRPPGRNKANASANALGLSKLKHNAPFEITTS
eukprot:TRINITY_DN31279_c0_g1_i1.p1 TRINITY_DN31279_c0_g1~~TRINITY_DN31279_c0_g1_i1.p1  ORF type:complete len:128 (-),score=7.43 TRINITY_DN31279_c0_g1_i1:580-963(-)